MIKIKAFTHIAAGVAAALIASDFAHATPNHVVFLVAGGIVGSMLPDIDHPKSAFGSKVIPISTIISAIFGHRGITHSLIATVGVALVGWYYLHAVKIGYVDWAPFMVGLTAGYLSHLLGDWMTNSGVPLLWPSKRKFVSPVRMFTGDIKEYVLALLIYGWDIFKAFKIFTKWGF